MTREEIIRKVLDTVLWTRNASDDNKEVLTNTLVKALESTTKNDLEVDAISRRSVIKEMEKRYAEGDYITKGFINSLPSVTPIRPKGNWICDGKGRSFADYHCSECGLKLALCGQDIKQRQDSGYSLFCGGCGADMREVKE